MTSSITGSELDASVGAGVDHMDVELADATAPNKLRLSADIIELGIANR